MSKYFAAVLVAVLLLVVIFGIDYLISQISFVERQLAGDLSDLQVKQIEIYIEMNKELMSLGTLVLGGIGALVSYVYLGEQRRTISAGQRVVLAGSTALAAFSIYMGYLSYDKMVWMLSKSFFNLDTPILYWVRILQLWSFLVSILLFIWLWLTGIE